MLVPSFSVVAALEGGAVQCQRCAGVVEDLHADVGCAAGGRVLQGQNGGIAAVDGRTGEGDGRFGGYRSVAIIQLDVETDGRTGAPPPWPASRNAPGLTERFDR